MLMKFESHHIDICMNITIQNLKSFLLHVITPIIREIVDDILNRRPKSAIEIETKGNIVNPGEACLFSVPKGFGLVFEKDKSDAQIVHVYASKSRAALK